MIWTTQVFYPQPWPEKLVISALLGKYLSKNEMDYLATLQATKRAHEFALGRALTRLLIEQVMGTDDLVINLSLPDNKAPRLWVNNSPWKLSIAHSMGAIVVAVSQVHPVGVDIQGIGKRRDIAAFKAEYPAFSDIQTTDDFYTRWVCLEAISKLLQYPLADLLGQQFLPDASTNINVQQIYNYWYAVAAPISASINHLDVPQALIGMSGE